MATTGQIFAAGGEGNGHGSLGNPSRPHGADEVHAEECGPTSIGQDFDAALVLSESAGRAVGEEWKYFPADIPPIPSTVLRFYRPSDFRLGVDDSGNGIVIHMNRAR